MKNKKKILIVCPYPQDKAPSQRLKYEQYFDSWSNAGYEIRVEEFINLEFWKIVYKEGGAFRKFVFTLWGYLRRFFLIFELRKYDLVYIHLWVTPFFTPFFEFIYCAVAKKVVYDIDDLVYLRENKSVENKTAGIFKSKSKPIYLMKHANHVITCTPYLDEFVRKYNSNTTDISSTVDTDRYAPINKYSNDKPITLGWSGSVTTIKYFHLLKDVLLDITKKYPIRIIVMGTSELHIEGLNIETIPWTEANEIKTLQKFDIGLYPLPDEEWVLGKSGLKAIQYMALGIPTIAYAIGANYRVIDNNENGFLVKTHDEWVERISMLIDNPELRKKIGLKARKKVENEFSVEANEKKYLSIFEKLIHF